jgi:hypothetical protein
MANDMTLFEGSKLPSVFRDIAQDSDDLSSGVSGSFAVISFRASKWRVKYQGEEKPLLNAEGDPIPTLELIILKSNPAITKNYYEQGYTEGAVQKPDCFSLDGIRPDPGSEKKQSDTCAKCPKNVFGSRVTPAGKKAKACQDNRRLAVVPVNDPKNEMFGGPMLLRIPAGSLSDLAMMGKELKQRGFPYNAVSVKFGFDIDASYPKLTFKPVRPLTEAEALMVKELLADDRLERILAEAIEIQDNGDADALAKAQSNVDPLFEQPTPVGAKPAVAPAPVAAAAPTPVVASEDLMTEPLDQEIQGILADLGKLG